MPVPLDWALDTDHSRPFRFSGYEPVHEPSKLGNYSRLKYDRSRPWTKDIAYHDRYVASVQVTPPKTYLFPQAWHDVAERLTAHGIALRRVEKATRLQVQAWRIVDFRKHPLPFDGRHLHEEVQVQAERMEADVAAGDWVIPLGGPHDRFIIEVLEPQGLDSYFRWAFFDSILDKKEGFSDYVFEDEAARLLDEEPGLQERFEAWRAANPSLLGDAHAVLGFVLYGAAIRRARVRALPGAALGHGLIEGHPLHGWRCRCSAAEVLPPSTKESVCKRWNEAYRNASTKLRGKRRGGKNQAIRAAASMLARLERKLSRCRRGGV